MDLSSILAEFTALAASLAVSTALSASLSLVTASPLILSVSTASVSSLALVISPSPISVVPELIQTSWPSAKLSTWPSCPIAGCR